MDGRISDRDRAWLDEALEAHRQKNSRRYRQEFFMPMVPPTVTHQEKKWRVVNGKPVPYEPDEVKAVSYTHLGPDAEWDAGGGL